MKNISNLLNICTNSDYYFFKFISANDTGKTGAHQSGFYMPRDVWQMFFDKPGEKGFNKDIWIDIFWPDFNYKNKARFIWYGKGTRAEYRLTNGFNFLTDDNVGDIFVLAKLKDKSYKAFLIESDDEIDEFLSTLGISLSDSYKLIQSKNEKSINTLEQLSHDWIKTLNIDFPSSNIISDKAREFYNNLNNNKKEDPDKLILKLIDLEYEIFKYIENDRYSKYLTQNFDSVENLIKIANSILNRRKSRAGASLENHLSFIFDSLNISYTEQCITEQNKKPDFIFPSCKDYHNDKFPSEKLFFLAVKTTCKDRWRQVINEADRIKTKYLFTLQEGISLNQLEEMTKENVVLVVPESNKKNFHKSYIKKILSLSEFIQMINILN